MSRAIQISRRRSCFHYPALACILVHCLSGYTSQFAADRVLTVFLLSVSFPGAVVAERRALAACLVTWKVTQSTWSQQASYSSLVIHKVIVESNIDGRATKVTGPPNIQRLSVLTLQRV